MNIRKTHKTFIIIVLSILAVSLLPGISIVWAEVASNSVEADLSVEPLIPAQSEGVVEPSPASFDDKIVQFRESVKDIAAQNDNSGISIVQAAAFGHTGQSDNDTAAGDWGYDLEGGYLYNNSDNEVCLAAPIYVPPKSMINEFTIYVFDKYTDPLTVYLDRTRIMGGWDDRLVTVKSPNTYGEDDLGTTVPILTDGSHIVDPLYNYHVDFCLPADSDASNMRVFGARVDYTPSFDIKYIYLPLALKSGGSSSLITTLFITNNTGDNLTYTVYGTAKGDISCEIAAGAIKKVCATFIPGFYNWSLVTTTCNPLATNGINRQFPTPAEHLTIACRP